METIVPEESWLPVLGFEGYYEVSSAGRVRGVDRHVKGRSGSEALVKGKIISQCTARIYPNVNLARSHKRHYKFVHIMVLEAFVGPRPPGLFACHNDGDCTNNSVQNLRWDTQKANCEDRSRHGSTALGSKCGSAKLKEEHINPIRNDRRTLSAIAKSYGVSSTTIRAVKSGTYWGHVPCR